MDTTASPAATAPGAWTHDSDLDAVQDILHALRLRLGMELSHLSEIGSGEQHFVAVDGDADGFGFAPGDTIDLTQTYCRRMLDGDIGNAVPDTSVEPELIDLPVTADARIGAYIGVPVHLPDGTLYGTLCCISHDPEEELGERQVRYLRVVAEVIGGLLDLGREPGGRGGSASAHIDDILDRRAVTPVYQPIVDLRTGRVRGVEALARFDSEVSQPPPAWFADAERAGRGLDLERLAVERAVQGSASLPEDLSLAVNVSPAGLLAGIVAHGLDGIDPSRLVVEVTEHAVIDDYDELHAAMEELRSRGTRLAVDDVGAGFASMRHVLRLTPDVVKLDIDLTRDVGRDFIQNALVASLVAFTNRIGSGLVAEGVETRESMHALRTHGVDAGQGYYFARPTSLPLAQTSFDLD